MQEIGKEGKEKMKKLYILNMTLKNEEKHSKLFEFDSYEDAIHYIAYWIKNVGMEFYDSPIDTYDVTVEDEAKTK
jgi:hypothetical protein